MLGASPLVPRLSRQCVSCAQLCKARGEAVDVQRRDLDMCAWDTRLHPRAGPRAHLSTSLSGWLGSLCISALRPDEGRAGLSTDASNGRYPERRGRIAISAARGGRDARQWRAAHARADIYGMTFDGAIADPMHGPNRLHGRYRRGGGDESRADRRH